MSTLPTTDVYGKRPSLQSGRLDRPGTGGVELAQAYQDAFAAFSDKYAELDKKQKNLNYTLARNEILIAEMEQRDLLSQDADWATHDKRYGEGLKGRIEEIRGRYKLDPYDGELLDAETRMITAKGRIDVAARARGIEVDQGYKNMLSNLDRFREMVLTAPTKDRTRLMEAALETIDIAESNGYFGVQGATPAEQLRQQTAQGFAKAVIDSMPAEERKRALAASLAYRRGYGVGEYAELVRQASAKYGLPAELIAHQIHVESAGDPNAKSGAFGDPTGLMQLGEDAAKDMGVTDRHDPAQSIDGGARYLMTMEERFDGDKAKALAAFNWGPGNVREAVDKYGDGWLAEAPEETRNYVDRLLPYWDGTAPPDKYMLASNTGQGPLTREDIAAGKGTGSPADFLHTDTVAMMLESAYKEDKQNQERIAAQDAISTAYELFPDDHGARMKWIADNTSGEVQKKAETDLELKHNRELAETERQGTELYNNYAKTIAELADTDEPLTMDDIPYEHREMMNAAQLKALEKDIQDRALGIQHPAVTQYVRPNDGGHSLDEWLALPDHGPGGKTSINLDEDPAWRQAFDREMYYTIRAQQENLKKLETAQINVKNVGPMVLDVLRANDYGGVTDANDKAAIAARLEIRLSAEVARRQQAKVPPQALTDGEIRGILTGYMVEQAYYDETKLGVDWFNPDNLRRDATFTPEQMKTAYLPVTEAMSKPYMGPEPEFKNLNMYEYLRERSKGLAGVSGKGADDEDIARAYWAYMRGLSGDEVDSRLRGE
jgi:hypothetical protein